MPQPLSVNLGLLNHFNPPGVWTRIDPNVRTAVAILSEVGERIQGVEHLCYRIAHHAEDTALDLSRSQIYLRASLSEFVSMEDAAGLDFERLSYPNAPRLESSTDPRLHTVRLLRHANVHLTATTLTTAEKPAIWHGPTGLQDFSYRRFLAKDLDSSIRATKNAARYSSTDLSAMISWVAAEQLEWGIQHVILGACETFARELAAHIPKLPNSSTTETGQDS